MEFTIIVKCKHYKRWNVEIMQDMVADVP